MRKQRELRLTDALITLFCFGIMIFLAVLRWDMTPHIPMLLGLHRPLPRSPLHGDANGR